MTIVAIFDPTIKSRDTFNTKLPIAGRFLLTNQSNVNLTLTFANGTTVYAPAWQITPFQMPTPEPNVTWQQQSILAGTTPISQITIDAYQPNEKIIGTYPVSIQHTAYIPNQVSTNVTGTNTLSNEGNPVNTEVIDIGTVSNTKLIDIFNDHFTISVEQSGVKHIVLTGRTTGKPLGLGQASDHTEVLGSLDIDATLYVTSSSQFDNGLIITDAAGHLILSNNVSLQAKNASGTAKSIARVDASNNLALRMADNNTINLENSAGTIIDILTDTYSFFGNNVIIPNNTPLQIKDSGGTAKTVLYVDNANDTQLQMASAGRAVYIKDSSANPIAQFDTNGVTLKSGNFVFLNGGQFARINGNRGTICGSATTISHGIGATPTAFIANPQSDSQPASATIGVGNFGSTTVTCTIGALSLITWWAFF